MKSLSSLLLISFVAPLSAQTAADVLTCDQQASSPDRLFQLDANGGDTVHSVFYAGFEYIAPGTDLCRTKFYYCINNNQQGMGVAPAISHVTFGAGTCAETCLDESGVVMGDTFEGTISVVQQGMDGMLPFCGIKFDTGFGDDEAFRGYCISVPGQHPDPFPGGSVAHSIEVLFKFGPNTTIAVGVPGPGGLEACGYSCTPDPCPDHDPSAIVVPDPADLNANTALNPDPMYPMPLLGSTFSACIDDPTSACGILPPGLVYLWITLDSGSSALPFGGCAPGTTSTILLDTNLIFDIRDPQIWMGPGNPVCWSVDIPNDTVKCGEQFFLQGFWIDECDRIVLTNSLEVTLGL